MYLPAKSDQFLHGWRPLLFNLHRVKFGHPQFQLFGRQHRQDFPIAFILFFGLKHVHEVLHDEIYIVKEKMLVQFIGQLCQRPLCYVENGVVVLRKQIPDVYLTHIEINFGLRVWPYIGNTHSSTLGFKCQRDRCDVGNRQTEGKVACRRYLSTKRIANLMLCIV